MSKSGINIIGGQYKGRKIPVIQSDGLRPTPNRVRETLFNWLQGQLEGINTLDLFAGSGMLSFEALSRGADSITLIEKHSKTFQMLKKNVQYFPNETIKLILGDAISYLKKQKTLSFDLIFIDPPFGLRLHQKIFNLISDKLQPNTLLYIESPTEINEIPFNASCIKHKQTGQVFYSLYKVL